MLVQERPDMMQVGRETQLPRSFGYLLVDLGQLGTATV